MLCKDGSGYTIYRRYSQFDEMHNALEKRFPIEAGAIKAKDRVLPTLPGKGLQLGAGGGGGEGEVVYYSSGYVTQLK